MKIYKVTSDPQKFSFKKSENIHFKEIIFAESEEQAKEKFKDLFKKNPFYFKFTPYGENRVMRVGTQNFPWLQVTKVNSYKSDYVTDNITDSVFFWELEGAYLYAENLNKIMGNGITQMEALKRTFDDWLLQMIYGDMQVFCRSQENKKLGYYCGRTRSHVWLHNPEGVRVLLICFNSDRFEKDHDKKMLERTKWQNN